VPPKKIFSFVSLSSHWPRPPPYAPWPKSDSDFDSENGHWDFVGRPRRPVPAPLPACNFGPSGAVRKKNPPRVGPKMQPAAHACDLFMCCMVLRRKFPRANSRVQGVLYHRAQSVLCSVELYRHSAVERRACLNVTVRAIERTTGFVLTPNWALGGLLCCNANVACG
jgi:hypothetical protein